MRILEKSKPIKQVHKNTVARFREWSSFFQKSKNLKHLVKNKDVHSYTVIPIGGDASAVEKIKKNAKKHGFLLGEGYGDLKATTFRIANFPALKNQEIKKLKIFLSKGK